MVCNQNTTGTQNNVAVGSFALDANTTASNNTAVGYESHVTSKHNWNPEYWCRSDYRLLMDNTTGRF